MSPLLEVRDLSFGYQPGKPLLRNISFGVEAGERAGLIGANGAGKSTLLWCLLGLHRHKGSVRLFGDMHGKQAWSRLGVVFQNPEDMLFMPRLADDISLPLVNRGLEPKMAAEAAQAILHSMGLEQHADEPASHLSLGQRKRAALASCLVTKPEFLVLDEPTAELDQRSVRRLADTLREMEVSCLITSHDIEFLRRTTGRLMVLHRGAIVADGETESILGDDGLLRSAELV